MTLKQPILKYSYLAETVSLWEQSILDEAEQIADDTTAALEVDNWMRVFFWFKRTQKTRGLPKSQDSRKAYSKIVGGIYHRGNILLGEITRRNIDITMVCGFSNDAFISALKEIEIDVEMHIHPMSDDESGKIDQFLD